MIVLFGNRKLKQIVQEALSGNEKDWFNLSTLKNKIKELKEQKEDADLQYRIKEAELKALVKIKEDKQAVDLQKKELDLKAKFQEKEMALLKDYHTKVNDNMETVRREIKDTYHEIMKRLPNVNVKLQQEIK